jgi:F-type H+-transporting ATPase subunit b
MIATSIFLLPNGTFFVELLVFVVLLFIAGRYILPPLNKALTSRQEKIRAALAAADAARAEAADADNERAKVLAEAREQARQIVAGAQATSDSSRPMRPAAPRWSTTASSPPPKAKSRPRVSTPSTTRRRGSARSSLSW